MALFDRSKKKKEAEMKLNISREIAQDTLGVLINEIKHDEREETLVMTRKAGSKDAKGIKIEINYTGTKAAAILYVYYIVKKLEPICGLPFEQAISFLKVINELMPGITKNEEIVNRETRIDGED